MTTTPQFVLYSQHGWADNSYKMQGLADSLADSKGFVVAPSLGFLKTWIRIEPLIQIVEQQAVITRSRYPDLPMRIVGHSMGGLIWLEVLARHPDWWAQVESIALVSSPIGGADLARAIDPFELGIGIARDLGKNRRPMAEAIAARIPTLVIAGDIDGGSDGTITVESTKVFGAEFVCLPGIPHAALANHPAVAAAIRRFWEISDSAPSPQQTDLSRTLTRRLQAVIGMTDAHYRDFAKAKVLLRFQDGVTLRVWKNPMGLQHVFVACPQENCLYGGFVGWMHDAELTQALQDIEREQAAFLVADY